MPKYEAISLLSSRSGGQYIQPGEVFELDDQEAEILLLNAGHIKAATETVTDPGGSDPEVIQAPAVKKSKAKT